MNHPQIARSFHEDGFAIVRGVFARSEIDAIERELQQFIDRDIARLAQADVYVEDSPARPIKAIHNLEKYSEFLRNLASDDRLLQLMRAIWPDVEVIPHGLMFFGKAARSGSGAPGQCISEPRASGRPVLHDRHRRIDAGERRPLRAARVAQGWATSPSALGRDGVQPDVDGAVGPRQIPEVQLCMQLGDICLHHTNTIHYSGPNTTDRGRRQFGIGYKSARAARNEQTWAAYQAELGKLHASKAAAS